MENSRYKFRAWDEDGYMTYPIRIDFSPILGVVVWDTPNTFGQNGSAVWLMQFTGLLDKNGKEIYEGDIITCVAVQREVCDVIEKYEKIVVEYSEGYFYPFGYNCGWRSSVEDVEIIGNIYENPELLK